MTFSNKDLGKGGSHLAQLVNPTPTNDSQSGGPPEMPIGDIEVFHQVRGIGFENLDVSDLLPSIKEHGILQALLVCPISDGQGYALIAGHRRLRAAMLLGKTTVPVSIKADVTYDPANPEKNETFTCLQLTENLQRQDLDPLQECLAIRRYRDQYALNNTQLSKKLGISRAQIVDSTKIADFFLPEIEGVRRLTPQDGLNQKPILDTESSVKHEGPANSNRNLATVRRLTPQDLGSSKNGPGSIPKPSESDGIAKNSENQMPFVTAEDFERPEHLFKQADQGVRRLTPFQKDEETRQQVMKLSRSSLLLLASVGDQPYFDAVLRRLLDRESIRSVKTFIKTQQKRAESSQQPPVSKPKTIKSLVKITVDPTVSGISGFDFDPKILAESSDLDSAESQQALAQFRQNLLACMDSGLVQLFPNQRFEMSVNLVLHARAQVPAPAPASATAREKSISNSLSRRKRTGEEDARSTSTVATRPSASGLKPLPKIDQAAFPTQAELETWFENEFWPTYPTRNGRKRRKAKAKAWCLHEFKHHPRTILPKVMQALGNYIDERGEDGPYVKDPVTWLPDWRDDLYVDESKSRCKTCGGSGKVEGRNKQKKLVPVDCPDCGGKS